MFIIPQTEILLYLNLCLALLDYILLAFTLSLSTLPKYEFLDQKLPNVLIVCFCFANMPWI